MGWRAIEEDTPHLPLAHTHRHVGTHTQETHNALRIIKISPTLGI